ncbi:MAG TPA: amidohydrolase family protein [Candidatus Saccharimonadales bacterium]|nr:amidohydrolase family protein [Candidatus Saccharimonadales bacterium]
MKRMKSAFSVALLILAAAVVASAQGQVTAVRAGKMFDPKSGTNLANQVILITGDKITDVGPADKVKIPAGAKVIDLSQSTVLPGLIDGHVHLTDIQGGLQHQMMVALFSATSSLNAGFTTLVAMGSHGGGFADVELKKAIQSGLVKGPRIITAGPIVNITMPENVTFPLMSTPMEPDIEVSGPDQFRNAVRELAKYGAEHVKIHTTGPFYFDKDGKMYNQPLPTREELAAVIDEAHRRGMWVASHTYGGEGLKMAIDLGLDNIQHATAADDDDIRAMVQKHLPITSTFLDHRQDEPDDLKRWAPYSRYRLVEVTWKKMLAAGVILGWGSGSAPPPGRVYNTECNCSHGVQGEQFPLLVSWGASPVYTLRMATTVNAEIIRMSDKLGSIDKGKFADIIAVSGDPLQDISQMQHVKFVMKGGAVIKNDIGMAGAMSGN